MVTIPEDPISGSKMEYVTKFFEHVHAPRNKEYYARDITEAPPGMTPHFASMTSSLISSYEELPGVNTPMYYIGGPLSNTALHDEDSSLASLNINIAGSPKVWLVVDHTMRQQLLSSFTAYMGRNNKRKKICPVELMHKYYVVTPSLLREWGVNFAVVVQEAGDLLFLRGGTFHFVINCGLNLAEAVNFGTEEWNSQISMAIPACNCTDSRSFDVDRSRAHFCVQTAVAVEWKLCTEEDCSQRFKTLANLKNHMEHCHAISQLYRCETCDRSFDRQSNLRRHIATHAVDKALTECEICHKKVRRIDVHKLVHNADRFRQCPVCTKKFTDRYIVKHVSTCNTKCSVCDKTFSSKRYLTQHVRQTHEKK